LKKLKIVVSKMGAKELELCNKTNLVIKTLLSDAPDWKWFFYHHGFGEKFNDMIINAKAIIDNDLDIKKKHEHLKEIVTILNGVWFELPDGVFNIMVNPEGWNSFLDSIENIAEVNHEIFDFVFYQN